MINEIAEVKKYLAQEPPTDRRALYRACYMIAKYMKAGGTPPADTVAFLSKWAPHRKQEINMMQCVNAAYTNDTPLHVGGRVLISDNDVIRLMEHAPMDGDRLVGLGLLCNAKAFADEHGVFQVSGLALASWLGVTGPNMRTRNIRRLCDWKYVEKIDTGRGKPSGRFSKYSKSASCYRMLVPYDKGGQFELVDNDIHGLYNQIFSGDPEIFV